MTELGNRLKEARLAKGMSLDDLQEITKIQKRYLQGIEEGNYSSMPGKFYVRAFIKQYAEAVGISPEELFEEYKSEVPNTLNEDISGQLSRVQTKKVTTDTSSKILDMLPKLLIVVFVIGAFIFIWYLAQKSPEESTNEALSKENKHEVTYEASDKLKAEIKESEEREKEAAKEEAEENKKETEEKKKEKSTTVAKDITVVKTQGSETVYELKNAEKFELKLVSTGETWVNIKNGKGYSFFQGMLKKGETESHTVDLSKETEAVIVIGNSKATEVYVNNKKLEYAVSPTEEVRQDITILYVKSE